MNNPNAEKIIAKNNPLAIPNNPSEIFTKLLNLNCGFSNVTLAIR